MRHKTAKEAEVELKNTIINMTIAEASKYIAEFWESQEILRTLRE